MPNTLLQVSRSSFRNICICSRLLKAEHSSSQPKTVTPLTPALSQRERE